MRTLNHKKCSETSYVLGSELWESNFDGLLRSVKEYIVDVWEIRKLKLYDSGSCLQHHSQSSPGGGGMVSSVRMLRCKWQLRP